MHDIIIFFLEATMVKSTLVKGTSVTAGVRTHTLLLKTHGASLIELILLKQSSELVPR